MATSPTRRALLLVVLLSLGGSGCSSTPAGANARFQAPADIVLFTGITRKNEGLHDYVAVASSRGDDLVFLDPADDRSVLSPSAVFPLSIATEPRPMRLAAAPLGDRASGGADLLVVASTGSLDLQVVETWTATNRVSASASVGLAPVLGEGEILALAALTPPSASAAAPRARVLVGASGGRLVVVDFTRDAATGAVVPGTPVVKAIGFDPVAIAIEPGGSRAFFATVDPLSGPGGTPISGVAWVDAGADPGVAWPVTALDARAPTRALAIGRVNERIVDVSNPNSPDTFDPVARFRIYAVLDSSGCGPDRAIGCGVATLDENGLLPDPANELPYRAPLPVPGIARAIAISGPPAAGTFRVEGDVLNPGIPLLNLQPGARNSAAVGAVTSTDGHVYLYDLSRYSPLNVGSALSLGSGISGAFTTQPPDVVVAGAPNFGKPGLLGLWNDFPLPPAAGFATIVQTNPASMFALVQVTPGYTPSDTWLVTWQGELPGLSGRRGVVGRLSTGETYVALQANAGTSAQPVWVPGVTVADPALGIHGGDVIQVTPDDPSLCATGNPAAPFPELTAAPTPFLAPDPARFPGGAVQVVAGTCFDSVAPGTFTTAFLTVRASGLVLTSQVLGYLGRPTIDLPFTLTYTPEATATGETLAIARKLRRTFYPVEGPVPCTQGTGICYAGFSWLSDPLAPGPTIAFRVGLLRTDTGAQVPVGASPDPAALALIPRDSRIVITTVTGVAVAAFRPVPGGVLPAGIVPYDPTGLSGHENDPVRFYAAFRDDQVLELAPSASGGNLKFLR